MDRFLAWYKKLPTEFRMGLAMLGVGTPAAIIWSVTKYTSLRLHEVLLIFLGLFIVIALVGWLITRIGKVRTKRRQRRMVDNFQDDSARGPVSMDAGAAIKANNDKFFTAVKDLKKNLKVSVYDLPWYIVIGEPGCGKTRLINEAGLTFSTGKPEGYQLGTLNYNWWFTEDAIFLDMAGRLCHPRDDGDYREWQAFLKTVAKGRSRCPINGAVICISAEHLLQDAPDKIEADANTTLERLRDLQNVLGVTFATYIIVTKCDRILGFMPFFDRAEHDPSVKNQPVGWSRPGDIDTPYDPESFLDDFDGLYARLHELRLRRLNDDADETELGLAYAYPEEFRSLGQPLQTYVRTLFPMMRNPRAVKNLMFRGVYFSSATQEGSLILRHLEERMGAESREAFQPLDLYPRKRPYFIKDLLFQKVFPEHGLVFRNEQQAMRNLRLSRFFIYGSVGLTVLLAGVLGMGGVEFHKSLETPRQEAKLWTPDNPPFVNTALGWGDRLDKATESLEKRSNWIKLLTLGFNMKQPISDLKSIRTDAFHKIVLPNALEEVSKTLQSGSPNELGGTPIENNVYLNALEAFVGWYGWSDGKDSKLVSSSGLSRMLEILPSNSPYRIVKPASVGGKTMEVNQEKGESASQPTSTFEDEQSTYFSNLNEGGIRKPASVWAQEQYEQGAESGLKKAHDFFQEFASLTGDHPDQTIGRWMKIRETCQKINDAYKQLVELPRRQVSDLSGFADFQESFKKEFNVLSNAETAFGLIPGDPRNVPLPQIESNVRNLCKLWRDYHTRLADAYLRKDDKFATLLNAFLNGNVKTDVLRGLNLVLVEELKNKGFVKAGAAEDSPCVSGWKPSDFVEVYTQYPHILNKPDDGDVVELTFTEHFKGVRNAFQNVDALLESDSIVSRNGAPITLLDIYQKLFNAQNAESGPDKLTTLTELGERWEPEFDAFKTSLLGYQKLASRGLRTGALEQLKRELDRKPMWGLASLKESNWKECKRNSSYRICPAERTPSAVHQKSDPPVGEGQQKPEKLKIRPLEDYDKGTNANSPGPDKSLMKSDNAGTMPLCATREFRDELGFVAALLITTLNGIIADDDLFSDGQALLESCMDGIERNWEEYNRTYYERWLEAYNNYSLSPLTSAATSATWNGFVSELQAYGKARDTASVAFNTDLQSALSEILDHVQWPGLDRGDFKPEDEQLKQEYKALREVGNTVRTEVWDKNYSFASRPLALDNPSSMNPWSATATSIMSAWNDLVRNSSGIAEPFSAEGKLVKSAPVGWNSFEKSLYELSSNGERITQGLVSLSRHGQDLLSAELTKRLIQEHNKVFPQDASLPFAENQIDSRIQIEDFDNFLNAVQGIREDISDLDGDLDSKADGKTTRTAYLEQCTKWRNFLGKTESEIPAKLTISKINIGSGSSFDIANSYKFIELPENFKITKSSSLPKEQQEPIRLAFETQEDTNRGFTEADWTWQTESTPLKFKLIAQSSSQSGDLEVVEGSVSGLGFCAYLSKGVGESRSILKVMHQFPRKDGKQAWNVELVYTLKWALPEPIIRLEPVQVSPARIPGNL